MTPPESTLEQLMHGYQQADPEALAQLVRKLSPKLGRFFREMSVTRPDAEDLLQDFWLRVHRARHTYRHPSPLLPWVFAIARHTRADAYRRLKRRQTVSTLQLDLFPDRRSGAAVTDSRIDLQRLVATLPDGQQEVIALKVRGMTLEEVARATGTTVGGVKQKTHRAYRRMRLSLASRAHRFGQREKPLALPN